MTWEHEVNWVVAHNKGKSDAAEIYRMCLAASVYYLWQERNNRIF